MAEASSSREARARGVHAAHDAAARLRDLAVAARRPGGAGSRRRGRRRRPGACARRRSRAAPRRPRASSTVAPARGRTAGVEAAVGSRRRRCARRARPGRRAPRSAPGRAGAAPARGAGPARVASSADVAQDEVGGDHASASDPPGSGRRAARRGQAVHAHHLVARGRAATQLDRGRRHVEHAGQEARQRRVRLAVDGRRGQPDDERARRARRPARRARRAAAPARAGHAAFGLAQVGQVARGRRERTAPPRAASGTGGCPPPRPLPAGRGGGSARVMSARMSVRREVRWPRRSRMPRSTSWARLWASSSRRSACSSASLTTFSACLRAFSLISSETRWAVSSVFLRMTSRWRCSSSSALERLDLLVAGGRARPGGRRPPRPRCRGRCGPPPGRSPASRCRRSAAGCPWARSSCHAPPSGV